MDLVGGGDKKPRSKHLERPVVRSEGEAWAMGGAPAGRAWRRARIRGLGTAPACSRLAFGQHVKVMQNNIQMSSPSLGWGKVLLNSRPPPQ